MFLLGNCYSAKSHDEKDEETKIRYLDNAIRWSRKSAATDYYDAMLILADSLKERYDIKGKQEDINECREWLEKYGIDNLNVFIQKYRISLNQ